MTLGTPTIGTATYAAHPATSISPPYPASIAAGDALILITGQQDRSGFVPTVTTPPGWTLQGTSDHAGGYGLGSGGFDTGDSTVRIFTKDVVAGTESGTSLALTTSAADMTWAVIVRVPSGAGAFLYGFAKGADTTAGSVSATMGSDPGFTAGDRAIWAMCIPTDVTTPSQFSAHNITATGATFGTKTELVEFDSNLSENIGGYAAWAPVTAGPSSAAPVITATAGGTTTNVRGPVCVLRVREDAVALKPYSFGFIA